jgi:hypothetical protein
MEGKKKERKGRRVTIQPQHKLQLKSLKKDGENEDEGEKFKDGDQDFILIWGGRLLRPIPPFPP